MIISTWYIIASTTKSIQLKRCRLKDFFAGQKNKLYEIVVFFKIICRTCVCHSK